MPCSHHLTERVMNSVLAASTEGSRQHRFRQLLAMTRVIVGRATVTCDMAASM